MTSFGGGPMGLLGGRRGEGGSPFWRGGSPRRRGAPLFEGGSQEVIFGGGGDPLGRAVLGGLPLMWGGPEGMISFGGGGVLWGSPFWGGVSQGVISFGGGGEVL